MSNQVEPVALEAYIATLRLTMFGKNTRAYGLLVVSPKGQSWHWGVKNYEPRSVAMEMFGLQRLLLAVTYHPDQKFTVTAFMVGAYLQAILNMAAKTKRDIQEIERDSEKSDQDKQFEARKHRKQNHDALLETSTLWDIFGKGMREVREEDEKRHLGASKHALSLEYSKIFSPLKTHLAFKESPDEISL